MNLPNIKIKAKMSLKIICKQADVWMFEKEHNSATIRWLETNKKKNNNK